jgi:hypothetical protein
MEAIITQGTFNKMVQATIRHSLMETPKEQYLLTNLTMTESRPECDGGFKDFGVFSDIQVHEVCELEAGPLYGVATDWLGHPDGKPVAAGIAWTREALCRDPNGYLSSQIPKLVDAHNEHRENKLVDLFIGYTPTYDRSGTLYNTYYEAGSVTPFANSGPWVNASDNSLNCPQDFTQTREMFWDMRDMVHGREIMVNTDSLEIITSKKTAERVRPLLQAGAIEKDNQCGGDYKYIMSNEVANGGMLNVRGYTRFVDRIMLRYNLTRDQAEQWWFAGHISDFLAWVYRVRPEVGRCPLGPDECRKRIVAIYNSYSNGYAYLKSPYHGVMNTGTAPSNSF